MLQGVSCIARRASTAYVSQHVVQLHPSHQISFKALMPPRPAKFIMPVHSLHTLANLQLLWNIGIVQKCPNDIVYSTIFVRCKA